MNTLDCLILAGGFGTRLRSVVNDRPKPMALVNGKPFLEVLIRMFIQKGVNHFVLSVGYMADFIHNHFKMNDLSSFVSCVVEPEPLGTGGAVKFAGVGLSNPLLLVNGDTYFDVNLQALMKFHCERQADITLSLFSVPDVSRYGSVQLDIDGCIIGFREKSLGSGPGLINAGVSLINQTFVQKLPAGSYSMEQDIFPREVQNGKMFGLVQECPFFDIGTPKSYTEFTAFANQALQP